MHATHALPQSKSHVLAGVQDAYWSDDEAVRTSPTAQPASVCAEYLMFLDGYAGGRGMPALSRGDGHLRSQLQALSVWLPGAPPIVFPAGNVSYIECPRSAVFAGITLRRTSMVDAPLVGGIMLMMLCNLNLSARKSEYLTSLSLAFLAEDRPPFSRVT